LEDARLLFDYKRYNSSINRSYYSIFNSILSILVFDNVKTRKHRKIIADFNQEYVFSKKVFERRIGREIYKMIPLRENCDYEDFYYAKREEGEKAINFAQEFYDLVSKYRNRRIME
jgi:uncharacterized protein (UPF0332 family)